MTHPIAGAHPPPGRPREEALLDGLTPEQAQAVQHGPGPLLLIAGPGAGKTKTLIHRIARLLQTGDGAAVGDPRGHVLGARGRRAATAARRPARRTGRARRHRRHVSLHLRAHAQRARRRVRPHRELHRLRPGRRAPRDRMAALRPAARADPTGARRLRAAGGRRGARRDLLGEEPAAHPRQLRAGGPAHCGAADRRRVARAGCRAAALERVRFRRFAHASRCGCSPSTRTGSRSTASAGDGSLVDEYQDTNEAQSVLVALLAGAGGNVCCVGDDDQCLLQGTEVTMADGSRRPIEQVKPGDLVLSAIGAGRRGPSRVLKVRKRRSGRGIVIRTAAGRTLSSTPEHIHFAGYRLGLTPQLRLVYIMRRDGYGFRLGTTSIYTRAQVKPVIGLGHRCLQEGRMPRG